MGSPEGGIGEEGERECEDGNDERGSKRPPAPRRGFSVPLSVGSSLGKASGSKGHTLASSNGTSAQPMTRENTSSGPQSPTLPPMMYSNDGVGGVQSEEDDIFDGEMLSSGQISPLSKCR